MDEKGNSHPRYERQATCCLVLQRESQRQVSDEYDLAYVNIKFVGWDYMIIRDTLHEIPAMDGSRLLPL